MSIFRTIGIVGSASALLFSATVAFAQDRPVNVREGMNEPAKNPINMRRAVATSTTATTTRREIGKDSLEHMKTVREEAQTRIKEQQEKAQQRLGDIKEKAKQQMADRLIKQFAKENVRWTDHFMKMQDRLDAILKKIQDRATIAASKGKDISAVTAAIASAQTAIATARTAVTTQAAKTYAVDPSAIVVTTSTTTPSGQEELMRGLRASFKNLHTLCLRTSLPYDGPVTDARKAVYNAAQVLGKSTGLMKECDSTANTNQ